jgi:hypothetical protein
MVTLTREDVEAIWDVMTPLQRAAALVLIEAQGRERAIHVPVIAARVGCNGRILQDAVKDMVEIFGLPIGTGSEGLWWMVEPEEFDAVIGNLTDRGLSNLTHAGAVRRIAGRLFPNRYADATGQGRLF